MSKFIVYLLYVLTTEDGRVELTMAVPTSPAVQTRSQCFDFSERIARKLEMSKPGRIIVKVQQCMEVVS